MQNILEVKDLSKQYGQQYALDNVSLSIRKGEIYGLIGKNGAGKTTLIKVISQLIPASSGRVALFGSQNQGEWTEALSRIGTVIEAPAAHNHLSAYRNLYYYCLERQVPHADQVIRECLDYVGLTDTGNKKFRDFSLGMKQRLGIAIALVAKPDLLILDEPINGLDPIGIKEFRLMVQRLNQELGISFIISSHILSELYLVASKFGILEQGRLVVEFTKEEFDSQSEDYIILRTKEPEKARKLLETVLPYPVQSSGNPEELHILGQMDEVTDIAKELLLAGVPIREIYFAHKDLENYFTDLVHE